ncbi:4Fe-4S binding protein [bacterium]|nr:4Fe-4S binding protein [candidate division CSSED10-310 bacterium]
MKPKKKILQTTRRISQFIFLFIFLFLFRKTDYTGTDELEYAVNIIFRIDPLVSSAVILAEKTFIYFLLPSIITILLTVVFGRFFCNWICPLGTLLDGSRLFFKASDSHEYKSLKKVKYVLLITILATAVMSVPLVGYFDPFSILVRGMTLSIDPALKTTVSKPFDAIYLNAPEWISNYSEPVYGILRATVLPYRRSITTLGLTSFLILFVIFALEKLQRRFWCRNICPLGAMLAVVSKVSLLRGHSQGACSSCGLCRKICRMGAIDDGNRISPEACTLCMDCAAVCPMGKIRFAFSRPKEVHAPEGISRRAFIGTALTGLLVPTVFSNRAVKHFPNPYLIRPPGSLPEQAFLDRCVRCGECMKVCIGNALHPSFLDSGIEGMFSPKLIPRIGYCEFSCTLCGQVCPTGAIRVLSVEEKKKTVIGKAYFDENRCLPYARSLPCIVCEEHCPTPDKAIKFREIAVINEVGESVIIKQPYVVHELCIGCGICETKCPIPGFSAIRVTSEDESRHQDNVQRVDSDETSGPYS